MNNSNEDSKPNPFSGWKAEFEGPDELRRRILQAFKRNAKRQELHRLEAELFAFGKRWREADLAERVAVALEHPSVGNLTWSTVKWCALRDKVEQLRKELGLM